MRLILKSLALRLMSKVLAMRLRDKSEVNGLTLKKGPGFEDIKPGFEVLT